MRKFKPPTLTQDAVGESDLSDSALLRLNDADFAPYPPPTHEDDHAAQYALDVQTFDQWKRYYHVPIAGRTVVLAPLGNLDEDVDVTLLMAYLRAFFPGVKFALTDPVDVGALRLRSRVAHRFVIEKYLPTHKQYAVGDFFGPLQHIRSQWGREVAMCVVGLTMLDLHMDSTDEFTMGCADQKAGIAGFSFARYAPDFERKAKHPEHHTSPFSDDSLTQAECRKQTTLAAFKTMTHEILHLLGVDHCAWRACLMNGSGHLAEDVIIPPFLCEVDLHKLAFALALNGNEQTLADRYAAMADVLGKLGADKEVAWLKKRIARAESAVGAVRKAAPTSHSSAREVRALKRRMLTAVVEIADDER